MSELAPEAAIDAQALRLSRAASTRTWVYTSQSQNPGPPPIDTIPDSLRAGSSPDQDILAEGARPLPQPPTPVDEFTHIRHSTLAGYDDSNQFHRRPLPTVPLPNPHDFESPPSTSTNTRRRRMPFVGGFISSVKRAMMTPHSSSGLKMRPRSGTGATLDLPGSEVSTLPLYQSSPTVPLPPVASRIEAMDPVPEKVSYVEATEMPGPSYARHSTLASTTPYTRHSTLAPTTPTPHRHSTMTSRTARTSHTHTPWTRHSILPSGGDTPDIGEVVPHPGDEESDPVSVEPLRTADYANMGDPSLMSETRTPHLRPATFFSSTTQSAPSSTDSVAMFFYRLYHMPWVAHSRITEDYHPGQGMPHRKKWNKSSVSWYNSSKDRSSIDLLSSGASPPGSPITPMKRSHYRPGREKVPRNSRSHTTYTTNTPRSSHQHHHHHHHRRDSRPSTYTPRRSPRIPSRTNTHASGLSPMYFQQPTQPMYFIQSAPTVAHSAEAAASSPVTLTSPLLMVIPSLPATMPTSGEGARYPTFTPPAGSAPPPMAHV